MPGDTLKVRIGLPVVSGGGGWPSTATLHAGHYSRMLAVIAAARTGDKILIELALKHYDEHGSGE